MAALLLYLSFASFYFFFQSQSIFGGDAGDLVTAAFLKGVAHPPGYPLYTSIVYLLAKVPVYTVAWRAALLSSLPAAGVLVVLYLFLYEITRKKFASLTAVLTLAFSYLFWLYAIVPEVFSLHIFLMTLLFYLLYKWSKDGREIFLTAFFFVLGLSLTHHHIIVFSFPSFTYLIFIKRKYLQKNTVKRMSRLTIAFLLGLLPYLYIPLAASADPLINWDNASNLSNFVRLVTRADYGTFQSGAVYAQTLVSRLIQIPVMFEFMRLDFTLLGLFIAATGAYYQFKKRRELFYYFFSGFAFAGPLYFFYASYILTSQFSLGTLERFLLPSYFFITIWIGEGIAASIYFIQFILTRLSKSTRIAKIPVFVIGLHAVFVILPASLFLINVPRMAQIKNDFSPEDYAHDILDTPPKNSILIMQRDTALFNTQYVYFTENKRRDIKLLHYFRLSTGELIPAIKKHYPDLKLPPLEKDYIDTFTAANYDLFPIYSNTTFKVNPKIGVWVREGLLFRLYKERDLPPVSALIARNENLWKKYHDPLKTRTRQEFHLMPSNILDFYGEGLRESGILFEGNEDFDKALEFYIKAQKYDSEDPEVFYRLSKTYFKLGKCSLAEKNALVSIYLKPQPAYYDHLYDVYKTCFRDDEKAQKIADLISKMKKDSQTPLKKL